MADIELFAEPSEDTAELTAAWRTAGISYSQRMFMRDDAHSAATMLGGLILRLEVATAALGAVGGWLAARQSRRVKVKIGDIEAEANSLKELEALLEIINQQGNSE